MTTVRLERRATGDVEWDEFIVNDGEDEVEVTLRLRYEGIGGECERTLVLPPGEEALLDGEGAGPSPTRYAGADILRIRSRG